MIYYIIPTAIISLSLLTVIFIVVKKFPQLATINVDSIPAEKNSVAKNRIILQRLVRKSIVVQKTLAQFLKPILKIISQILSDFYQKIISLEKLKIKSTNPLKDIDIKQKANDILLEAQQLLEQEKIEAAEAAYIKVIDLDKSNSQAYTGLMEVYLANRDYRKARETCRYNLKLLTKAAKGDTNGARHQLAGCQVDLGSIYQLENKPTLALKSFEKAVAIEPNNPRFLDLLLKISIMLKRKDLAQKTFVILKEADPDNQKLPELQEEINGLPEAIVPPATEKPSQSDEVSQG